LLIEEFARHGVEVEFLNSPKAQTPEEHLLVQFQGMIAEYERAQIAERTRRGKRHRAKEGSVNVLSGAPYGYRYVKKSETTAAYYEIIDAEAAIVREVYRRYTEETQSISAIVRWLNETEIPTRKGISPWERTTVWAMLRNPAYRGMACFGKTELAPRKRLTRSLRQRGGYSPRVSANRERPQSEWLEIPVPALVSEVSFALAQEQLEKNKRHAARRTIEPTLLQGMLACQDCGYAYYRTSTRTSSRKIYYYRCLGSDDYRYPEGRRCQNRPIRQDYLDDLVWGHVVHLLEDPSLIRAEIDRRVQAMTEMLPTKRRQETIAKELTRVQNSLVKLLDAYQESVLTLEELRQRLPPLRKREQTLKAEAHSLESAAVDQTVYLRLAETVEAFLARLRSAASTLSVPDRQKILRLVVKEILVNHDAITLRHSIPITPRTPAPTSSGGELPPSYLLRKGSHHTALRGSRLGVEHLPRFQHAGL
jgi:site-specific DNA recombinase